MDIGKTTKLFNQFTKLMGAVMRENEPEKKFLPRWVDFSRISKEDLRIISKSVL